MLKIIADDYGLAPDIDRAIGTLSEQNKLHKTSVMANPTYTPPPLPKSIEIGLHIDLTTPRSLAHSGSRISPKHLLLKPPPLNILIQHITAQLDLLQSRQFEIQYLDTHQHVHVVPRIFKALIHIAQNRQIPKIRCLTMQPRHLLFYCKSLIQHGFAKQLKKMLPLYTVGRIMAHKLNRANIAYSPNLILMPLAQGGNYKDLLATLINHFQNCDAEFVTHPGLKTDLPDEPYLDGREIEYHALADVHREDS
ncbi:MAG: ChbG/HpnK family deacetylase [Candidatus Latescibacteria bacterium]|jgi:predicted glycoside hydrolase/deacetylase ChbG (UPF0249 family)|nr:ChbG/HpnK family deacetylase [Candidatus Latescibacterota bacterium]